MSTRLGNLRPTWLSVSRPNSGEGIQFDCPVCAPEKGHRLVAYFENALDGQPMDGVMKGMKQLWRRSGDDFKTLSIMPSIQYPCFHGWIEVGRVFQVKESPIVVVTLKDGQARSTALSPLQTIEGCTVAIKRAHALLGNGPTGDDPPATVGEINEGGVCAVHVGDVYISDFEPDEALALVQKINAFFGYPPNRVKISSSEEIKTPLYRPREYE